MLKQPRDKVVYAGREAKPANRDFYGTPGEWIDRCRQVMGGIELDPASWKEANEQIVKADRFFDKKIDALKQSWECDTLFLNPPYSNKRHTQLLEKFAAKFINEWEGGVIGQAIILINNVTETNAFEMFSSCSSLRAETRRRIQFVTVTGRSKTSNTRGQVFFYYGRHLKVFKRVFKPYCRIVCEV